jgi:AhpD family alkylhydroperoxidase
MMDFGHNYRSISRAQIELVAGRVSALNECFY